MRSFQSFRQHPPESEGLQHRWRRWPPTPWLPNGTDGWIFSPNPKKRKESVHRSCWESWGEKRGFWTSWDYIDYLEIFGIMLKHRDFLLFSHLFIFSYCFLPLTSFEHFWLNSTSQLFSFLDSSWSSMEPAARLDCGYELWMICHRWHMPSRVPCPLSCMCTVSLCLRAHQSQI